MKKNKKREVVVFNYGMVVKFNLDDIKVVCKALNIKWKKNIKEDTKRVVYDKLVEDRIDPVYAVREDGCVCDDCNAAHVFYKWLRESANKEDIVTNDTRDDAEAVKNENVTNDNATSVNSDTVADTVDDKEAFIKMVYEQIYSYSIASRFKNIPDYRLYSLLKMKPCDCRDALNTLYKNKKITVKPCGNFKLIIPTSMPTADNRYVSKESCLRVFSYILKYESESAYFNVPSKVLEQTVANVVGVITLQKALQKLVDAGYVEARVIGKMTVYSTTKAGRDRIRAIAENIK